MTLCSPETAAQLSQVAGYTAVSMLAYMSLWFALAFKRKRLDTVDTAWGLGFALVAWSVELQNPNTASLVVAILVSVWALRLASHIWRRSIKKGEDPRYKTMTAKWHGNIWARAYLMVFLLQGLLILIVGLPIIMLATAKYQSLAWLTVLGAIIWACGFIFEAIADRQLAVFLKQKKRPKVLETGLWRYSRHPNYFGEIVLWWGIGIIALQTSYGWIGLLGPLTLSLLIIFVSGIPPIEKRRQADPAYQAYKKRTSSLIPLPPRK